MPIAVSRLEKGHMTLYAVVVLPVVISLAVLAVDVSRFQTLRDAAQSAADRLALDAAHALPDSDRARATVRSSLARVSSLSLAVAENNLPRLDVSSSRIDLTLQGSVPAVFDIFLRFNGRTGHVFTLEEHSSVQLVPGDYVIVFTDGASMRPAAGESWGEADAWPASGYFNFVRPPVLTGGGIASGEWPQWWTAWNTAAYRRWATQACYNPLYSGIKYGAVALVDLLGAVETNRIALLTTPGESREAGFRVLQPLGFVRPAESAGPQAAWTGYFEKETFISDESCVYFASPELSADARYHLAQAPAFVKASTGEPCPEAVRAELQKPDYYFPYGALSGCFLGRLQLREAVYYHAARNIRAASGSLTAALDQAFLQLFLETADQAEEAKRLRGNLAPQAAKRIVLFADDLPDPRTSQFLALCDRLEQGRVELFLVPFVPQEGAGAAVFAGRAAALQQRIDFYRTLNKPFIKVMPAWRGEELDEFVVPAITAFGREFAIQS